MKFKCQRGAQIVEFALVLPFLLVILFLIFDFGFLVYNQAVITNASREAARAGSVLTATPWSTTAVAAVACNYAKNSLISTRNGTHTTTCSGDADPVIQIRLNDVVPPVGVVPIFGDRIKVQITYAYSGFLTPATTWLLSVPIWNLTATTTMNHE
jgi:hypothetical protein